MQRMSASGARKPRKRRALALRKRCEELRAAARGYDLVVEVAHLRERPLLGDELSGEGDRAVARACPPPPARRPGRSARGLGRRTCSPEVIISSAFAGPTMRGRRCVPPAPGSRPSFTSGRPHLRRRHGDAVVAGQRDFEAAAERGAVDRGDDRLRRALDRVARASARLGASRRLAELGDVGAGDEGAAVADQHDRLGRRIGNGRVESRRRCRRAPAPTARSPAANSPSGRRRRLRAADRRRR